MSQQDVFGPILDNARIEQAWLDLARKWIDTYLVAAERAAGEQPRTWDRPRHWRLDDEARILIEDVAPLLVCVSSGDTEPPSDDSLAVVARKRIQLAAYYRAGQIEDAHVAARRYGWALAALCEHKASEIWNTAQLLTRPRESYGDVIVARDMEPLGQCVVDFDVLAEVRSRTGGPADPIDPDDDPPQDPDVPVITDVDLTVDAL